MNFLKKHRYKRGLSKIKALLAKPHSSSITCNLRKANRIGIIYEANSHDNITAIKQFVAELKKTSQEVVTIGYYDSKSFETWHLQPLEFYFFCNSDLNWYFKPKDIFSKRFINRDFDILINFTDCDKLPCNFISLLSKSSFKVGKFLGDNLDYFDLNIKVNDLENSKEENFNNLINQIKHYLLLIKPN